MGIRTGKRKGARRLLTVLLALGVVCTCLGAARVSAEEGGVSAAGAAVRWDVALAIGLAIGLPSLAAGYAIAKVGAAALGAAAEKPELLVRSLAFVALGEGIAVFGFLVALLVAMNWAKGLL